MDPPEDSQSVWSYCEHLDRSFPFTQLRPEDQDETGAMIQLLEAVLARLPECPDLPDSPAGKVGAAVWARLHPDVADLDLLLRNAQDDYAVVRFAIAGALQASCEAQNRRWREPSFTARAREALRDWWADEESPITSHLLTTVLDETAKFIRHPRRPRTPVHVNPYVAGVPVKDADKFFGRQDILNEIRSTLGKSLGVKSLVLYGARRTGKTSILFRIKDGALGDSFVPVYMDMQGFAGVDANAFLVGLSQAAVNAAVELGIRVSVPALPPSNAPEFRIAFQDVVKKLLEATSQNLLVMIDEYEVLLEFIKSDPTLALQLQHLMESEANLFFLFAGSHAIESIAKLSSVPLLDAARYLKITFLSQASALELVVKPAQSLVNYAPGVPEKVLGLTAGHPFYTQLMCQFLFDRAIGSEHREITLADLNEAVETFMRDPSPHLILTWNALQHEVRVVGSTLAALTDGQLAKPLQIIARLEQEDYPSSPDPSGVRESLTKLQAEGWVEEKPPDGSYRFTMELVRKWVAANRSAEALIDEQRKRLGQTSASAWRQWFAEFIDVTFSLVPLMLGGIIAETLGALWAPGPILIYFICPMMIGRFSIGLRIFNLYPLSRWMTPLGPWRAAAYGLLLLTRTLAIYVSVYLSILASEGNQNTLLYVVTLSAVGCLVILILMDIVLMYVGAVHGGLYERLGGVVLIYRTMRH